MLGPDGVSDFTALNSGKRNEQAQLYAFDRLAGDGEDHRRLPVTAQGQSRPTAQVAGIFLAKYEQGEIDHIYSVPPAAWRAYRGGRWLSRPEPPAYSLTDGTCTGYCTDDKSEASPLSGGAESQPQPCIRSFR